MLTSLGKFLRTFRINEEELLKDMAEKLDVAPAYLSSIENGKRAPTKKLIDNIVSTYELSGELFAELNSAFFETLNEVSFSLKEVSKSQRDLCISFSRRFTELSTTQVEEIKKILEESTE